jgi:DnaJ-domain-containing protein 1
MGWLEFAVIIVCGLFGFMVVNAVMDRRSLRGGSPGDESDEDKSWWETLNIDENASAEQIKTAFRREISKYHPDRVEGLGMELQELADRKAKQINRAYTLAKQARGFT